MQEQAQVKEQNQEKSFTHINRRTFLLVLLMLVCLLAVSALLSYFIPRGSFERTEDGAIIPGTYLEGEVQGIALWRVITAPARVFVSDGGITVIMICLFLLVMSGVFNVIDKTGGVRAVIRYVTRRFADRRRLLLCVVTLLFMCFGSFFGMFEELASLIPIIVMLALSLGFDTMTGLGVCLMATCFGFSCAITNPFSVGLASEFAGIPVARGMWLRIVLFVLVYAAVLGFLLLHARRIAADPTRSLSYEADRRRLGGLQLDTDAPLSEEERHLARVYGIYFAVQLAVLLSVALIPAISGYAIPILSLTFLCGIFVVGRVLHRRMGGIGRGFLQGAVSMLPAVLMIALASSVKLVMEEGGITDTVLNAIIGLLGGKSPFFTVLLIYALILFLQIFIGSATAKIMLVMPLLLAVGGAMGLSPEVIILTYCMADGFTDVILPTNPVLLIGLSMAGTSYGKWVRFTWKIQLLIFALTVGILWFAVKIGY